MRDVMMPVTGAARRRRGIPARQETKVTSHPLYEQEHEAFRATVRGWIDKHVRPHAQRWDDEGIVDREMFTSAARDGVLGFSLPEEYGGGGVRDFRFNAVLDEELSRSAVSSGAAGVAL